MDKNPNDVTAVTTRTKRHSLTLRTGMESRELIASPPPRVLGFDLDIQPQMVIWGQKIIPFESPYMTSYLTSMDNISLSRTVFEIFDFQSF